MGERERSRGGEVAGWNDGRNGCKVNEKGKRDTEMDAEWKRKSNGGTGRNGRTKEAERNKGSGVDMGG